MKGYSKEGLIAAGLLSAAAFALGDLWAAALRSMEGPWLQDVGAAMEAVPSVLATQGISAEPNALLGGSICFLAVWLAWAYLVRSQGNRRIGEEHGSARWGTKAEGLRFADTEDPFNNVILTENYGLAVDPGKRRGKRLEERPRNVLVIGGTGAGKTWRYSIPNILQMNADYFVIDSKGTQLPLLGNALVGSGYEISCMNLVRMSASAGVNPFSLIRDEVGIIEFAECFIANTTGDKDHVGDQFWVQAERLLYTALIGYLMFYCPSEDRNFGGLVTLLSLAQAREDDDDYTSPLDLLFREIETGMRLVETGGAPAGDGARKPGRAFGRQASSGFRWVQVGEPVGVDDDFVLWCYKAFKDAAGKTMKGILISCNTRLMPFSVPQLRNLTDHDELELSKLGDAGGKRAVFVVSSDTSSTFSFMLAITLWQTVNMLCDKADALPGGSLARPVHFICDEFANVGRLPDIEHVVSVIRSRNVYMSIILQSFAQLKSAYGDDAQTIVDNCDTLLYLGGKSVDTQKMISEMIGKETVEVNAQNVSRGNGGSTTTNTSYIERDLMQASEVGRMGRDRALVLFSNAAPLRDSKYPTQRHPRYELLAGHPGSRYPGRFDYGAYLQERRRQQQEATSS
ncbi:MAG: VirD4-like conjugal transfer protein, CD1115 family [Eggerthella lenta]